MVRFLGIQRPKSYKTLELPQPNQHLLVFLQKQKPKEKDPHQRGRDGEEAPLPSLPPAPWGIGSCAACPFLQLVAHRIGHIGFDFPGRACPGLPAFH